MENKKDKLSITSIRTVLNNLAWNREKYNKVFEYQKYFGFHNANINSMDFDLIESFQTIFNHCENYELLNKVANIFNTYVETAPNIWLYETYWDNDKMNTTYNLKLDVPHNIREKVINLANTIKEEITQNKENFY